MKSLSVSFTVFFLILLLETVNASRDPNGYFSIRNSARKNNHRMGYGIRVEELLNPETYHKYIRPGINFEHPLFINISIAVSSIDEISDVNMEYTVTFTLYQSWRDDRLDKLRLGNNLKPVTMDASVGKRMWVPDTYIVNAHNSFIHDVTTRNGLLMLYPNGTVIYVLRITSRIACPMKLFKYPMDEQVCHLKLASWSFTEKNVLYKWNGEEKCGGSHGSVTGVENVVLPQFNLTHCSVTTASHARVLGNYSELVMEFGLKRNVLFFIMQTYVPSILLVMLSWVSFWINVNAVPARVALGITTVLSMTTLMIGVYNSGPKSTSYVKAVDCYVLVCYGFIFVAMIEYAGVHFYLRHLTNRATLHALAKSGEVDDDDTLPNLDFFTKGNYLQQNGAENMEKNEQEHHVTKRASREFSGGSKNYSPSCRREKFSTVAALRNAMKTVEKTDKLFRVMAPGLFMTFNILYWCIYLTMKD